MEDINDIFAAEEERLLAEGRAAIAAEDAAWDALPQAERDRIAEERWAALFSALDEEYDEEEDDDDDAEQDDDDDQ